jgi:hypothetical protein
LIARYATNQLRLLVHWDAELYTDLADLKKHVDHLDDLTPDRVFETFIGWNGRQGSGDPHSLAPGATGGASHASSAFAAPSTALPGLASCAVPR